MSWELHMSSPVSCSCYLIARTGPETWLDNMTKHRRRTSHGSFSPPFSSSTSNLHTSCHETRKLTSLTFASWPLLAGEPFVLTGMNCSTTSHSYKFHTSVPISQFCHSNPRLEDCWNPSCLLSLASSSSTSHHSRSCLMWTLNRRKSTWCRTLALWSCYSTSIEMWWYMGDSNRCFDTFNTVSMKRRVTSAKHSTWCTNEKFHGR